MTDVTHPKIILGWREWASLPELGVDHIKIKIDTGARSSALHAFFIEPFNENGVERVRFGLHPDQFNQDYRIICEADITDRRKVRDSGGNQEERFFIQTQLAIGPHQWPIEMNVVQRDTMRFRMLLGRTALHGQALVNPAESFLVGPIPESI